MTTTIVETNDKDGERDIPVVTDTFAQCENKECKKWVRLYPTDPEDGMRTIPLFNIYLKDYEKKMYLGNDAYGKYNKKREKPMIWVCEDCWDKREERLLTDDDDDDEE